MPDNPMPGQHHPSLVRPHPPLPGTPLLDLLAEPPEQHPAALEPSGRDPIAMALAGVAALFATVALGVSVLTWLSLSDLQTLVAVSGANPPAAGRTQPEPAASGQAVAPLPGQPLPNDQFAGPTLGTVGYSQAYRSQSLQLSLPPCRSTQTRYVDLDEPRVDADASRADLFYKPRIGCYGTPQLHFVGGVTAAVVTRPTIRPAQCATSIKNAPADNPIALDGTKVICVLTASDKAIGEDITQKMVILVATAPTPNGQTTVRVTAWNATS